MTERAGYGVKKDYKLLQLEQNEFPILCNECMGDSGFLKLLKKPLGQECKICTRPFTVFTWKIKKNTFQTLKTEICSTCAKINNCCQCCIYDLKYHLPIEIRNQLMGDKKVELLISEGNRDIFAQLASENFDKLKLPYDDMPELDSQDLNLLRKKNMITQDEDKRAQKKQTDQSVQSIDQLKLLDKIKKAQDIYDVNMEEKEICIYYVEKQNKDLVLEKVYEQCQDNKFQVKYYDNILFLKFDNHKAAENILKVFYNNLVIKGIKYDISWQSKFENQNKKDPSPPPEPEDSDDESKEQIDKQKKENQIILQLINQQILIMGINKTYEDFASKPFEERKNTSERYMKENPTKVPIIFRKSTQRLKKVKFLIPKTFTVVKLIQRIKRVCKLHQNNTFYIFVDKSLLNPQQVISQIYENYKNDDGFLYLDLQEISAFGNEEQKNPCNQIMNISFYKVILYTQNILYNFQNLKF